MDKSAQIKFEKTLNSLEQTDGVEGTLVVDNQGEILYNSLLADDVSLFGSMANIISNSSEKLLDSVKQGLTERVLVESKHGNALFISMEKAHLVVLTTKSANIGMVMISSKTAAQIIKEMPEIKEIELIEFVEEEIPVTAPEISEKVEIVTAEEPISEPQISPEELTATPVENEPEKIMETKEIVEPITETSTTVKSVESVETIPTSDSDIEESAALEIEPESIKETSTTIPETVPPATIEEPAPLEETMETLQEEKVEKGLAIPVIRPPLAFPPLPDNVEIPESMEEKTALIISIYESVLLAMSIGASKIMGFAPARGMLIKSLPYDKCPDTLNEVNVKSNSALEFDKIRANLNQLPLESQVEKAIQDFTTIISAITDNYGRVMGYDAFRGMIRPEFKKIYDSYGSAMEELGIREKIHPELRELLVN